jgi:hypothetical protein
MTIRYRLDWSRRLSYTGRLPWFQRFIFIIFIAKGRGKINLWNQGTGRLVFDAMSDTELWFFQKCPFLVAKCPSDNVNNFVEIFSEKNIICPNKMLLFSKKHLPLETAPPPPPPPTFWWFLRHWQQSQGQYMSMPDTVAILHTYS